MAPDNPPLHQLRDPPGCLGEICLTLNRPDRRNPLSDEMFKALQKALEEIAQDTAIKAVILAANGSVFSAGHDLKVRTIAMTMTRSTTCSFAGKVMLSVNRLPQQ